MRGCLVGLSCLLGAIAARADDPVFSGPQVGEALPPFKALAISGPKDGREVVLPGVFAGKPTVLIFVNELTRPGLQLIRPVDHYAAKWADAGLNTRVVWLTADPAQTERFLERSKNSLSLKSPVVIALGGAEGPGEYGLNRNVTLTILVANGGKVTANFAIVQPNGTDAPKVLAAVAPLVGKPAPSADEILAEPGAGRMTPRPAATARDAPRRTDADPTAALAAEIKTLTASVAELRARVAKLEGSTPRTSVKVEIDPGLERLIRKLIRPDASRSEVDKTVEEMVRWAGDDPRKKAELAGSAKLVLGLGSGSEPAKASLKRLAKE